MKKISPVFAGKLFPRHEKGIQDPCRKAPTLLIFAMCDHNPGDFPCGSIHMDAAVYLVKQKKNHCLATVGNVKCTRESEAS